MNKNFQSTNALIHEIYDEHEDELASYYVEIEGFEPDENDELNDE